MAIAGEDVVGNVLISADGAAQGSVPRLPTLLFSGGMRSLCIARMGWEKVGEAALQERGMRKQETKDSERQRIAFEKAALFFPPGKRIEM